VDRAKGLLVATVLCKYLLFQHTPTVFNEVNLSWKWNRWVAEEGTGAERRNETKVTLKIYMQ